MRGGTCASCGGKSTGKRRCYQCQQKLVKAGMLTGAKWLHMLERKAAGCLEEDPVLVVRVRATRRHTYEKAEAIGGVWFSIVRMEAKAIVCSVRLSQLRLAMRTVYGFGTIEASVRRTAEG